MFSNAVEHFLLMRTCYEQPWENDVMVAMLQITQHEIDNYTMYGASTEVLRWLSGEKEVKALVSDMKEDVNRQDGLGSMELLLQRKQHQHRLRYCCFVVKSLA
mgnify:CR=1 FL=1